MSDRVVEFVVYDLEGTILRSGACPRSDLELQALGVGENVMEGEGGDITHKVDMDKEQIVPRQSS